MARSIETITLAAPKAHNPVKAALGRIEFRHRVVTMPNLKRRPLRQKAAGRRGLRFEVLDE